MARLALWRKARILLVKPEQPNEPGCPGDARSRVALTRVSAAVTRVACDSSGCVIVARKALYSLLFMRCAADQVR